MKKYIQPKQLVHTITLRPFMLGNESGDAEDAVKEQKMNTFFETETDWYKSDSKENDMW